MADDIKRRIAAGPPAQQGNVPPNVAGAVDNVAPPPQPRPPRMTEYARDTMNEFHGDGLKYRLTPDQYRMSLNDIMRSRGSEAGNNALANARAMAAENATPIPSNRALALGQQNFQRLGGPTTPVDYAGQPPRFGPPAVGSFSPATVPPPGPPRMLESPSTVGLRNFQMRGDPASLAGASRSALAGTVAGPAPEAPLALESPSTVGLRNFQMRGDPASLAGASRSALAGTGLGNFPPASPPGGGGGPGGSPSRGPISGVAAPAATLASMMYSANEQSKDPRSLVYRAVGHSQPGRDMFDLKSYPTSMADVENRGLDTAIAIGELGRGLYNTAMHPIDSVKNAVVGNMTGLAQAMASGYNRLQGNNPNGTRRMPVGPMMMEAPMPAPRDGDPNSPFPDPAATPINKTPARFALDQEDAARQAQRPVAAPRPQTADERYNAYWKAVAPNGLGDYNMRMARDYALSHTPAKDITAHIGNVMSGQGSYEHARAQAQELPKQTAINLRNAMANERTARANEITANRPVRDTRDPVKVAQATTLTAIQDAYRPIFANAKTPQELKAAKDAFYDEWIKAGGKITYDGNQLEMIRNMQGQDK